MSAPVRQCVTVQLMGPLTAVVEGQRLTGHGLGSRKARTVLGVLAAAGDTSVSAERLVDAAWPERPPAKPGAELAILVSRLRAAVGTDAITGNRLAYRLNPAIVSVDVEEAARLVAEAEGRQGEPALAVAAATGALALLEHGDVADDEPFAEWADQVRGRVTDLRRRSRLALAVAALATHDPTTARRAAEQALAADPLDEEACRLFMRAAAALGEDAVALAAYEQLRLALAEALGADPSTATRDLHLAVLQGSAEQSERGHAPAPVTPRARTRLVGRDAEVAVLADCWKQTLDGCATLLLVTGEAGIGKTTLAAEMGAVAAGALLLQARCYEAERSLFLQPLVEAIGTTVAGLASSVLADVVVERADVLASLVPEVASTRPVPAPAAASSPDAGRRQAYDAVTGFFRRLSRHQPLVLVLDDLHNAGLATVDLLHYLVRTLCESPLMIVATVRTDEGTEAIARLAPVAQTVELAPLDDEAVSSLVSAAGQGAHLPEILASTSGHPLFVVETLRGLASGQTGIPRSLQDSVIAHVARQGREGEAMLRAAAVLGASFEPADLAAMTGAPLPTVARACEDALRARLLSVDGRAYAFSYDVTREVLYRTTPEPTRVSYHLRAADRMAGRPESMAIHAAAAGDRPRAAKAWLLAGEQALQKFAAADAEALLDSALTSIAGLDEPHLAGHCHLERGRTREVRLAWPEAIADYRTAERLGRDSGDSRLEMMALWMLGWDSLTATGEPISVSRSHLEDARRIARRLGDRAFEARALSRLAVLACNDLDFVTGRTLAEQATALSRQVGDEEALVAALDGLKTVHAYLAETALLAPVLDELMPLVRRHQDVVRLQWALFESAFPFLGRGDWEEATARVEEALAYSRGRGSAAYEAWFLSNLGWVARLQGRPDDAVAHGRRAMEAAVRAEPTHAWCRATAATTYATTLLRQGRRDEAAQVLTANVDAAHPGQARAYRARFAAAMAEATSDPKARAEAELLLGEVSVPAGSAWLLGWDAYASLAAAQRAAGDASAADATVAPLVTAAERLQWAPVLLESRLTAVPPAQSSSASMEAARAAPSVSTGR